MKIFINQLLSWISDLEENRQIERVLWIDTSGTDVITIDINHPNAQPIFHKYNHIEAALVANRATILENDPCAKIIPTNQLSDVQRKYRDEAWKAISLIIAQGEKVFYPHERSRIIKEAVHSTGRSEPTIRKDLRRYWQGGQTKNSLLPNFDLCGGKGKERQINSAKRGRPSLLSIAKDQILGVNVDADIQDKFRKGIRLFYENSQERYLTKAYQDTLEKFFAIAYRESSNSVKVPILPPAEELPSFRQFQYWYEKNCDITKKLISRHGERRFNLRHRATLGDSTQMAFGPGSVFQIDATIADVYLVSSLNRSQTIGRPTLYLVVDVFSRLIVGFVVTLEPSSWLGAMLALENVTEDKVEFCRGYGINITEAEWASHHLPKELIADRGEFEGYNADNLVNSILNIDIHNTSPYRADMKGIIEQSFNQLNNERIHWLPGSVKKLPERGDRDYRLDGVLTLHEFRQLMILSILDHNNEKCMYDYPMSQYMIQDEVEPYPANLWQWGVENRVGSLHWKSRDLILLNLLPSAKASITREGIVFNKLHYTCELAMHEQWFVRARNKGSWRIDVAYDPRLVNQIYIRLDSGNRMEICYLLEVDQRFQGCDFREVETYYKQQRINQQAATTRKQQSTAALNAHTKHIISKATEETQKATDGQSKRSRIKNIHKNREEERNHERKIQTQTLGENSFSGQPAKVIQMPNITQKEDSNEGYVAAPQETEMLNEIFGEMWNHGK
ncbi:HMG-I and HMG-Y, DNA-binding protein [Calothrix sp. NIES-2100]|uniref:Mu transposase C-terminal domain-containing protein n=1 Tax=Calothrix sp. NIES-2100 TaxID=1954172 RepID=UPI000B5F8FB6|nr:HMG-I and HMG-Y, DNA-binding protein [Calothrix sp. NIES-2100]